MTRIDQRKSRLTFETSDTIRERGKWREVVFEVENGWCINIRLKGLRSKFPVSPAGIYNLAVRLQVEKDRLARKGRRSARGEK